jgi:hypothetical protein
LSSPAERVRITARTFPLAAVLIQIAGSDATGITEWPSG